MLIFQPAVSLIIFPWDSWVIKYNYCVHVEMWYADTHVSDVIKFHVLNVTQQKKILCRLVWTRLIGSNSMWVCYEDCKKDNRPSVARVVTKKKTFIMEKYWKWGPSVMTIVFYLIMKATSIITLIASECKKCSWF